MGSYRNLTNYRLMHVSKSSPFFEEPNSVNDPATFQVSLPEGWAESVDGTWHYAIRSKSSIPMQGWKIHLSSVPAAAQAMLDVASKMLFNCGVSFKFLHSWGSYMRLNGKNANRSSSGKFITIYPANSDELQSLLERLEKLLADFEGPYILSDVRYGKAPIFVRYGGFRYLPGRKEDGTSALMVRSTTGVLVEDRRVPFFIVPPFASVPDFLTSQVEERLHGNPENLELQFHPYSIEKSLHFGNAGGVYLAKDKAKEQKVVMKEARRYAGFSSVDVDAVCRLRREREVLIHLQGLSCVPKYLSYKTIGDHEFLVEQYAEGQTLQSWVASNYPFSLESDFVAAYAEKAKSIARNMVRAIDLIHSKGLALVDVNPKNFIIGEYLEVHVVDFEAATALGDSLDGGALGMPGFIPLESCAAIDRDNFGAACVIQYLFRPAWTSSFSPELLTTRLEFIRRHFGEEPYGLLRSVLDGVPSSLMRSPYGFTPLGCCLEGVGARLAQGIISSRLSGQDFRLYPGDATQFRKGAIGGIDVETGAAGVALALSRFGVDVSDDADWMIGRIENSPSPLHFHGLLAGEIGILAALSQLGRSRYSASSLPAVLPDTVKSDISIRTGISGTVLALIQIANDSGEEFDLLSQAAAALKEAIVEPVELTSPCSETGNARGLFDGWAGAAIACHELAVYFPGESVVWESLSKKCLECELALMEVKSDGTLWVDYSGVDFGYLAEGAAGIAFALSVCGEARYRECIQRMLPSLKEMVALNGGLFYGSAGKAVALNSVDKGLYGEYVLAMTRNIEEGFCFVRSLSEEGPVWFLGNGGMCLSADYSSGAAGFLCFLLSLDGDPKSWFPVSLH